MILSFSATKAAQNPHGALVLLSPMFFPYLFCASVCKSRVLRQPESVCYTYVSGISPEQATVGHLPSACRQLLPCLPVVTDCHYYSRPFLDKNEILYSVPCHIKIYFPICSLTNFKITFLGSKHSAHDISPVL